MIKHEPVLGLSKRSGRYWLLVLREMGKGGAAPSYTFYDGVFRPSGIMGHVNVGLKLYLQTKTDVLCT